MLVCEPIMSMETNNAGAGSRTWAEEIDAQVGFLQKKVIGS